MKTSVENFSKKMPLVILLIISGFIAAFSQNGLPENAITYTAKGRNGWLVGQQLSFGPFYSSKVKRSWTSAPSLEFVIRLQQAKDRFRFELMDDRGNLSEVYMTGKLSRVELPLFDGSLSLMLPDDDIFVGMIITNQTNWEFYLENPNKQTVLEKVNGKVTNGELTFIIEESHYLSNGKKHIGGEALAYNFRLNGKVIGMVEVINKGKVMLDDSLSSDQKFVLANAAAALLLRQNLMDTWNE